MRALRDALLNAESLWNAAKLVEDGIGTDQRLRAVLQQFMEQLKDALTPVWTQMQDGDEIFTEEVTQTPKHLRKEIAFLSLSV